MKLVVTEQQAWMLKGAPAFNQGKREQVTPVNGPAS